jgi:hypothetical protein
MTSESVETVVDLTQTEPQPDPNQPGREVLRVRMGPITVEYRGPARRAGILGTVALTIAGLWLAPLDRALWILGFGTLATVLMIAVGLRRPSRSRRR